jgi:ornithine decarboxylase
MVELSSKFGALPGEAVDLIAFAHNNKLEVEGLSFHVGSQCTNIQNYIQALDLSAAVFAEARTRGYELKLLDIGGGFRSLRDDKPSGVQAIPAGHQPLNHRLLSAMFGDMITKRDGSPGLRCDRVAGYRQTTPERETPFIRSTTALSTFSVRSFDPARALKSFKKGPTQLCAVFGPTCDALDTISLAEQLPDMELGDFVYAQNIGAYSAASSTFFNGFPPARVVHVNQ